MLAYERNQESIQQELKRQHPRHDYLRSLIKLTFHQRRLKINSSASSTVELLEEFSFFKNKKWVCTTWCNVHALMWHIQ